MAPHPTLLLTSLLTLLTLPTTTIPYTPLSDPSLHALPRPASAFDPENGSLLSPLLQPRVPGSEGSTAVQHFFSNFFRNHLSAWTTTFQNSTYPIAALNNAPVPFANFIAQRAPPGATDGETSYLTLVAHYDSLREPDGFIGAIDSAAPCAMLLHAALVLDSILTRKWSSSSTSSDLENKGIQILFLDGEEAFGTWSHTDSLYGARSLAQSMEQMANPALSTFPTALSSISLFLLLDLLGAPNPSIPSFFKTTHWAYTHLSTLHARLSAVNLLRSKSTRNPGQSGGRSGDRPWFPDATKDPHADAQWLGGRIEDDHLPFMARGVEVLHLIPNPFPPQWHKAWDDGKNLDLEVCGDWAVLVAGFAAEWMDLEGFVVEEGKGKGETERDGRKRKREVVHDGNEDGLSEGAGGKMVTSKTEL